MKIRLFVGDLLKKPKIIETLKCAFVPRDYPTIQKAIDARAKSIIVLPYKHKKRHLIEDKPTEHLKNLHLDKRGHLKKCSKMRHHLSHKQK
jgi:hypothetical protein